MKPLDIYKKLFLYLEKKYFENKIDDLGLLLGDMKIINDGASADIAVLNDWYNICNYEVSDRNVIYQKCILFLREYAMRLHSIELENLISQIEIDKKEFISEIAY